MPRGKWLYQDPRTARWVGFDEATSRDIETAHNLQHQSVEVTVNMTRYRIEFHRARMTNLSTYGSRAIRREAVTSGNPYEIGNPSSRVNAEQMEAFFRKHQQASGTDEPCIQGEGLMSLAEDLGVSIDDDSLLLLACRVQATEPFKIGHSEFINAMRFLEITSPSALKKAIPQWRRELQDKRHFKYYYWFAFEWTKEDNARVMQPDAAVESWQHLLGARAKEAGFPMELWCEYILKHHQKPISKDAWKSLLDFITTTKPDMSNYDESEGWPVLMDEFVEWVKPRLSN